MIRTQTKREMKNRNKEKELKVSKQINDRFREKSDVVTSNDASASSVASNRKPRER